MPGTGQVQAAALLERTATAHVRPLPPGPASPLPMQTALFWPRVDPFLRACRRRYGPTFTMRVFPWGTVVVVSDPEAVKTVFTGDPSIWRAGESYDLLAPLIGERSVVLLDGAEHLHVRKRMLPPFHGEMVRRHEQLIETIAAAEVARWPVGRPITLIEGMRAITLEVMLRAVIGAERPELLDELRVALADAVQLEALVLLMWAWPPLKRIGPWRAFIRRLGHARSLLSREIQRRRADPAVGERSDVLSLLISAGELDDDELLDQLATLLLAGHDTSTTALAWALERLVRHPAALARARRDEVYLGAVVKESLRLRPVLPAVARRVAEPVQLAGHTLPAGTTVMPCIRLLHLSPDLYPDPTSFRPERFLEGQGHGYAWIPFGGGTRRCIGASFACSQMRIVLRTVLDRAGLSPERPTDEPIKNRHITLVPGRGGRVVKTTSLTASRR